MSKVNNEFSITFFLNKKMVMYLKYTHGIKYASLWMDKIKKEWDTCNIYERKTRKFLQQIKKGDISTAR